MWRTLAPSVLFLIIAFSYGVQADVAFVTLTAVAGDGLVVGNHACQAVHRHSRVLVADARAAPMVASGLITVSVIELRFPLGPVPIVIRRNDVDLAGDRSHLLHSGKVPPVTLAGVLVRGKRWKLDNEVHSMPLDQTEIL